MIGNCVKQMFRQACREAFWRTNLMIANFCFLRTDYQLYKTSFWNCLALVVGKVSLWLLSKPRAKFEVITLLIYVIKHLKRVRALLDSFLCLFISYSDEIYCLGWLWNIFIGVALCIVSFFTECSAMKFPASDIYFLAIRVIRTQNIR